MDPDGHNNRENEDNVERSTSEWDRESRSGTPLPVVDLKDHVISLLESQNRRLEGLLLQALSTSQSGNSSTNVKLPEFDPKHEGADPKSWCATVECCLNNNNNSGGALVVALGRSLKGEDASWFTSVAGPDLTWDAFKSAFLTQWDAIDTPGCVFFSFLRSQPKDCNETYITFASRMIHKLTASWKGLSQEQIAVAAVLGQLALTDSRVRRLAHTEEITSREQLLKEMRVLNYKRPTDSNDSHDTPKKARFSSSFTTLRSGSNEGQGRQSFSHPLSFSSQRPPSVMSTSQRPTFPKTHNGDVTCYFCSGKGHFASRCPKKEESRRKEPGTSGLQAVAKPPEKRVGVCQLNPTGTLVHKELDIGCLMRSMQLEGTSKRKRRSSASNGGIENSPVCEAKRLREDDRHSSLEGIDHLGTEERLPLTELPVRQPYDSDEDGSEWLEACTEDLVLGDEEEEEDERDKLGSSEGEDITDVGENLQPSPKIVCDVDCIARNSPSPKSESFGRLFFQSRRYFANIPELMHFFQRKLRSGAEDRKDKIFCENPGLQPKMRSVLLEWIVEVCDVYKLHRETYHLTVDYLDRYLSKSKNISKGQLQLIGVTALLIAAKYEEIYPPKICDFAYITDGACTDQDIIKMENLMVQVLEWRCTVITSNTWVLGFLQLLCVHEKKDSGALDINIPLYKHPIYETIMHLLDLCSLDCSFAKYPYKVLALSGIHIVIPFPDPVILKVSGYESDDLAECMKWMQPFWVTISQKFSYEAFRNGKLRNSESSGRASDFSHLRIKHNIDLDMLEAVQIMIEANGKRDVIRELLLTPPSSSEKRKGCHNKNATQVGTSNGTILV